MNSDGLITVKSPVNHAFGIAVGIIGMISTYDAYLVFKYREGIIEQNPICQWLIQLEPEFVSCFLIGKGLGTLAVLLSLVGMYIHWRRAGMLVTFSLLAFQVGLMAYLHTSETTKMKEHLLAQQISAPSHESVEAIARKANRQTISVERSERNAKRALRERKRPGARTARPNRGKRVPPAGKSIRAKPTNGESPKAIQIPFLQNGGPLKIVR